MTPASMWTRSDSTSLRALVSAVAGMPSLSSRMTSSLRPASCHPFSSQKSSHPLYMSLPACAMAPESGARKPSLTGPWARADGAHPRARVTAIQTIPIGTRIRFLLAVPRAAAARAAAMTSGVQGALTRYRAGGAAVKRELEMAESCRAEIYNHAAGLTRDRSGGQDGGAPAPTRPDCSRTVLRHAEGSLGLRPTGYLDGRRVTTAPTRGRVRRRDRAFLYRSTQVGFDEAMVYHHVDRAIGYLESRGYRGARAIVRTPLPVNAHG